MYWKQRAEEDIRT